MKTLIKQFSGRYPKIFDDINGFAHDENLAINGSSVAFYSGEYYVIVVTFGVKNEN